MVFYYKGPDQAGAIRSQPIGLHDEPNGSTIIEIRLIINQKLTIAAKIYRQVNNESDAVIFLSSKLS
jgi:hypothetical protein